MKLNKKIQWILTGVITLSFFVGGCSKYLNKEPIDLITPDLVWRNQKLIDGVLVSLYNKMQFEGFDYWDRENWRNRNLTTLSDEAQGSYQKDPTFDNPNATWAYEDEIFGTFEVPYEGIRQCNDFLGQLESSTLAPEMQTMLSAEVRFIRAWHYFTLVKRYGGIPLITESQEYTGDNLKKLRVPRSSEADVYDFVVNECEEISENLPLERNDGNKYRATRGAALALCSRAALYAGSIAMYGEVKLDGLLGIPPSMADSYYRKSFDASEKVIESGVYSLYDKYPNDKAKNFYELFQKGEGENNEYIFEKAYDVENGIGHSFDKMNAPFSFRQGGWGCGAAPVLELVEAFEYKDGSSGKLKLENQDGSSKKFDDLIDVFKDKDPRLFGSVFLPGSICKGEPVVWQRGIINSEGDEIKATRQTSDHETYHDPVTGKTYAISGKDGGADVGDASKTGFYQRKFWDDNLQNVDFGQSSNPRPVFRLGEIYLNLAEAALEMDDKKKSVALDAVNKIRKRAGIALLSSISIEDVRHERKIELAFEGHRYWDMHRWRIAALDASQGGLNGFRGSALYPWFDVRDQKYIFKRGHNTPKEVRIFLPKNYYLKIPTSAINSNPEIIQNPGYTN